MLFYMHHQLRFQKRVQITWHHQFWSCQCRRCWHDAGGDEVSRRDVEGDVGGQHAARDRREPARHDHVQLRVGHLKLVSWFQNDFDNLSFRLVVGTIEYLLTAWTNNIILNFSQVDRLNIFSIDSAFRILTIMSG